MVNFSFKEKHVGEILMGKYSVSFSLGLLLWRFAKTGKYGFMTFTVSTSGKHLENVAFAPSGEELFRKTRYTLAFS